MFAANFLAPHPGLEKSFCQTTHGFTVGYFLACLRHCREANCVGGDDFICGHWRDGADEWFV